MSKNLLLLAVAVFCLISSCNKDRDRDQNPNVLPDATQSGANTAGALVDGKVWVATKNKLNTANGSGTYCEKYNDNYTIKLDLRSDIHSYNNSIFIKVLIIDLELGKTYDIISTQNSDFNIAYYINNENNVYTTKPDSVYTGNIKITRIDITSQIVSGTFEFKGADSKGNVVNITEGRFDKHFD